MNKRRRFKAKARRAAQVKKFVYRNGVVVCVPTVATKLYFHPDVFTMVMDFDDA